MYVNELFVIILRQREDVSVSLSLYPPFRLFRQTSYNSNNNNRIVYNNTLPALLNVMICIHILLLLLISYYIILLHIYYCYWECYFLSSSVTFVEGALLCFFTKRGRPARRPIANGARVEDENARCSTGFRVLDAACIVNTTYYIVNTLLENLP